MPSEHDLEAGRDIATTNGSIRPERMTPREPRIQDESDDVLRGTGLGASIGSITTTTGAEINTEENGDRTESRANGKGKQREPVEQEDPV
jgi:hypothetical protein